MSAAVPVKPCEEESGQSDGSRPGRAVALILADEIALIVQTLAVK